MEHTTRLYNNLFTTHTYFFISNLHIPDLITLSLSILFTFTRRFYPKRLTVHSGYTFVLSVCVFPGNRTHNLCAANAMLYHWATGTQDMPICIFVYYSLIICVLSCCCHFVTLWSFCRYNKFLVCVNTLTWPIKLILILILCEHKRLLLININLNNHKRVMLFYYYFLATLLLSISDILLLGLKPLRCELCC